MWLIWWFAAHWKPQSCDLLVRVTTKPQHGQPRLPLSHCGAAQSTQKHTPDRKTHYRDVCTYAHIVYGALADGRIMSFPQADRLCQQPVLRRCVFSSAKSITGSHVLSHTDWILNQKHDLNQQIWAKEIYSAQSANQISRIYPGKSLKFDQGRLLLRHFWATHNGWGHTTAQVTEAHFTFISVCRQQGPAL